jgi:hypothetical protein
MKKNTVETRILETARLIVAGKGQSRNITLQSALEKDLGFDMFDLSTLIMQAFPAGPLVPDTSILPQLIRKKNLQLKDLCSILHKNLVPLEKYLEPVYNTPPPHYPDPLPVDPVSFGKRA